MSEIKLKKYHLVLKINRYQRRIHTNGVFTNQQQNWLNHMEGEKTLPCTSKLNQKPCLIISQLRNKWVEMNKLQQQPELTSWTESAYIKSH